MIVQNKIDLVDEKRALENHEEITRFVKGSIAENAPIIPVSAQHCVNIDALIKALEKSIPTPKRDLAKRPRMYILRSFDINKPGTQAKKLAGGVIGGTILQGKFGVKEEIEIRPGIRTLKQGRTFHEPLLTEITTLHAGGRETKEAQCGGLVGIGTLLDPSLTKADGLIGNLVGQPGMLPPTLSELTLETHLFERAVGTKELAEVEKIRMGESLLLDIGTNITAGNVASVKGASITLKLRRPVCAEKETRTAISRKLAGRWRLIGYGILK